MSAKTTQFQGFGKEAFRFLAELEKNNNKDWFDANRDRYESAVLDPAMRFVAAAGPALKKLAPGVSAEPRIGGALFRIHRDTRFSDDKRPYKTHVGIRFRDAETNASSKCTGPLFYVEFDARSLRIGAGIKEFDPLTLTAFRELVAGVAGEAKDRTAIRKMLELADREGREILGPMTARVPAGYPDGADAELLRRKGCFVRAESKLPAEIHGPEFVDYCAAWFKPYVPLFRSLRAVALAGLAGAA